MPIKDWEVCADDIVVSGLSGRLPESDSIEEFAKNLFDGIDLVTADDRRWPPGIHGLPERHGKLKDLTNFDAAFFGIHDKEANFMDPQLRMLLEITHEAIIDAGFNPEELRGSRTGVYVGVSSSETGEIWDSNVDTIHGYGLTGCHRAMFPNRISHTFDFKGPSYAIDTACSSSMYALAQATAAIRAGYCDAAIVAGTNICLIPNTSLNPYRLNMLSAEGRCAAFDADGSGYVRSEAVVAVLVQRRRACRRLYCTVHGARMNTDGYKTQGVTYPSGAIQRQLAQETFEEAHLQPQDVVYLEAHGTGTKAGDPEEVNAIAELFCEGRKTPLLIGSVKSNMGHSEPAAGLCSIVKVVVAMEREVIPANLHYRSPNPDIPALSNGSIKVVDRNTPWQGGLVAVNSFGFGGANAHVILESQGGSRPPPASYPAPRLVLASGRTEAAVARLLRLAAEHPRDAELHALLDAVHARAIPGHTHRGFALLNTGTKASSVLETLEVQKTDTRPIWFIFAGMGSQWPTMGRALMQLPTFAASIARMSAVLRPLNFDLTYVLTEAPETVLNNIMNSAISITAIQVAMVDVLREVGIRPDGIMGHSAGEIGCAYADDTLTVEQTIICMYWRARCTVEASLPPGAMAAVGLSWAETERRCPPDVFPACHNAADNVTVSGPPESLREFVAELQAEGVFARSVESSGLAFHSKYIAAALPPLQTKLLELVPEPRPRSKRWVSTSLPPEQLNSEWGKLSSAEYFVNNMLSPVRFADALLAVPERAIVVEVAPHALLHAVLRRALPSVTHVPLVRRDHPDPLAQLLQAVGRLFAAGAQPRVGPLYPPVAWPVSRGTPMLASAVEWDHSKKRSVADFKSATRTDETMIEFDLGKPDHAFLAGHNIDGRLIFPAAGYLTLVWRTVARVNNLNMDNSAVVLEDVQFCRATIISREGPLRFFVTLSDSGNFKVCEGEAVVVTGRARLATDPAAERLPLASLFNEASAEDTPSLDTEDIYKELRLRGYNYQGLFRKIVQSDAYGTRGLVTWEGNWISFIDTMLQFGIIAEDARELKLPTGITRVLIDPAAQRAAVLAAATSGGNLALRRYKDLSVTISGGVELRGIKVSLAPRRVNSQAAPRLEKHVFTPLDTTRVATEDVSLAKSNAVAAAVQLMLENSSSLRVGVAEVALGRLASELLLPLVLPILGAEPQVRVHASLAAGAHAAKYATLETPEVKVLNKELPDESDSQYHLVLGANVLEAFKVDVLRALSATLHEQGHVLLEEPAHALDEPGAAALLESAGLVAVARQRAVGCEYVLLRRAVTLPATRIVIEVRDDDFVWVEALRDAMKRAESEEMRVYVWSRNAGSGVLGLGTCLRREAGGNKLRVYYLPNAKNDFDPEVPAYRAQVQLDLSFNALRAGVWGTYRHLLFDDPANQQIQVEHAYVNTLTRGDLSSLSWIENNLWDAAVVSQNEETDLCRVYYAPLNYNDIMLATGKLSPDALSGNFVGQECFLGQEFSGHSSSGKRVMGIVAAKALATTVIANAVFMWEVPAAWSLEEASTVPVAYSMAYYALAVRGKMRRGETVLVHAGTSDVGQAAISIALHAGCTVFTTVDTPDEHAFLLDRFSTLSDANIGNSFDCSFEQLVQHHMHGRGVDLILNSLARGDQLQASLRCLKAVGGRFLEMGRLDHSIHLKLNVAVLLKNIEIHGILLSALFDSNPDKAVVVRFVSEGIVNGAVRPLPATVFADCQLEQAFRYMATGKHIGKVLLRIREEESSGRSPPRRLLSALPRTYMHPAKSYVLVGGLGGFGLELGNWLIKRGARTLVLNSRSGVRTGYQAWCIHRWREAGVLVEVSTADATTAAGAHALLGEAARTKPVGGIFHLAAVLRDAFLENQTPDDFRTVAKPKIDGTRALDAASRELAPELEHFVVFSSVTSGRGNPGQSNYGLANSAMERLCEQRQADGLPALAVQWGAIGDVGLIGFTTHGDKDTEVGGLMPQHIASCLTTLGALMSLPYAVTSSFVLADKHRSQNQPSQELGEVVANILGIKNISKVSGAATLPELGMDSLMGAEIKQTLERNYNVVLSVQEIRGLTLKMLQNMDSEVTVPDVLEKPTDQPIKKTVSQRIINDFVLMQAKERRPVWFVFGGMGCQWPRMGRALMQQPTFAASIARLSAALRPLDFDLTYMLTEAPEATLDNIINSAISISAVQIALVDVLREAGIHPDGIVGHSAGEIGSAYADDALTGEQVVICMYWRARCIVEASLPPGAMAAVGLSWAETERRCPSDVFLACHNTADNVTVAGPPESVRRFIAKLEAERVFAYPVDSSGLAFHSKYIAPVLPRVQTKLEELIPEPRTRSARWISTSLTPDQEDSEWGKLCSAKYFVNNMLSPVRFVDALKEVPERALVVEIAPNALLNSILRCVLPSATHVPLVRRDHPDPLAHLQEALDLLFAEGAQPHVSPLDPPVIRSVANSKLTNGGDKTITMFDLGNPDTAFLSKENEPATSNEFADQFIKKSDQTIDKNLVPFINFGELIPKQVIVKLPSLPPPSANTKPVFVIHPIEGVADLFASVAACVRGAVYGLQCTRTAPLDSMPALASFYVQHVRATQPHPPYTLLGYSFGASVAVEMALQLESEGCPVRLVLVEGSPAFVASHISRSKVNDSMRSAQADEAAALIYFAQTIKDSDAINGHALLRAAWPTPSELERLPHWDARATRVTGLIVESGLRFEKEVLNFAAHTFYRKLLLGATYKPATKLTAPVMLFRARDSYVVLGEDYGLRAVCSGQLRTHELIGTHRTVLEGESGRIIADYVCSINV